MDPAESLFAVVVIGVDHDEGFPNQIFGRQHRLSGAPGFGAAFRQLSRDIADILEGVVHFHAALSADGFDSVSDNFSEIRFDILSDDKNNFVKAGFDGIVDGIIHNDVAVGIYRFQLFNAAPEARTDTRRHNYE